MPIGDSKDEQHCEECGQDFDVDLPPALVEDCHAGKLLLFVGAGASTESHNVMPHTFYDVIADELGLSENDVAFPDLMQQYVSRFSKSDLILEFVRRLRYISNFPELYRRATQFHRLVGQIPFFKEIVTTNWDDYFERETDAVPLVQGPDLDYWDLDDRKVLKIHGSILNPGSMIATRDEYSASLRALRRGALGGTARHLLATRSVVFVGYSLRDEDIRDVIAALRQDLATAARRCYFVHPSPAFVSPIENGEVLRTSAAHFVRLLDRALVDAGYLLPLTMYERLARLTTRFDQARAMSEYRLPMRRFPLAIYNRSYQDGMVHAIERAWSTRKTGDDRRHGFLLQRAAMYEEMRKQNMKRRRYWDSAYIEGYFATLLLLAAQDLPVRSIPLYYCPGVGPETSFARAARAVRGGADTHQAAYRWAVAEMRDVPEDLLITHRPFL